MTAPNSSSLSSSNVSNIVSISQTGSKWEQALQRLIKEDRELFNDVEKSSDNPRKVLDDVLAAANERKDKCVEKRGRLVVNGRTIYFRDVLEKLSSWVKNLVHLPWAAIRLIMQTTINNLEVFGHIIISLENLASIVAQCHIIESVYIGGRESKTPGLTNQLTESIVNLYAAILQYLADIIQYFARSTWKRILKSIGQSQTDFQAKYLPVERAFENFGRIAGITHGATLIHGLDLIESIHKQLKHRNVRDESEPEWLKPAIEQLRQPIVRFDTRLQNLEDSMRERDREKILGAISNIPHGTHHKQASEGLVEGSGVWFLEKLNFKEWRTSSSPSVLWLHGIPGSGKTKLTSLVIRELWDYENVAYFYCMRNPAEPQRAQCNRILGSLVRQLASVSSTQRILRPVAKCYEDAIKRGENPNDLQLTTDESVNVLLQLFDEYPAVTLVLDALDEVNEGSRQELLDALNNLIQQSTSVVRIFISSRSNYDIALSLDGAPNIYIGADDNAEDISTFIDKKLTEAKLLHGRLDPKLRTDIVNTLEDGAKGIWIQSLRPLKLPADVRTRLGKLPATLEASYWEIFQQIRTSGENALALATFTIQWLLYAKQLMSPNGFAALISVALATELNTKYTTVQILDVCSNLIVERENSFEFAHLSVREFFEKLSKRQINTYLPEEGHAALAQACLQYLNQALVPEKVARERAMRVMYSKRTEVECEEKSEGDGQKDSTEVEIERFLTSWANDYDLKFALLQEDINVLEFIAVLSSNVKRHVPSDYVVTWMVHHVDAAGSLRLKPELSNLLKAFVLQHADPSPEAAPGRTARPYTVAPGFRVWRRLTQLRYWKPRRYRIVLSDHGSPIWLACELGWLELVEYLYQNPYDIIDMAVNTISDPLPLMKLNPFWYAIATRRMELASCIAAFTSNKSQTFAEEGGFLELLHTAVRRNDTELIKLLAKLGPRDHETAISGFTEAAFLGHHEAIRMIVEPPLTSLEHAVRAHVDPDCFAIACANGSVETVKSLIENTTTVTTRARFLYLAVFAGHVDVVRLLLEKQVGLGGISTALKIAVSKDDRETIDLLIQYGGKKDSTTLFKALRYRKPQLALHLIAAGYEVNNHYQPPRDRPFSLEEGWTALHFAVDNDCCEIVEALLGNQARVNARDLLKQTPLHLAAKRGCKDCVESLIDGGADLLAKDYLGKTALQVAKYFFRYAIVDLIGRLCYSAEENALV
ncbi:hypothetical protein F4801DRAFT_587878 [Xylaria longipes]|nr:hypothetical protein F4801DRAFT_587878 [Xylaria longipes]